MIKGTPKIDAIALGEFTVKFIGPSQLEFNAKAAFVNNKNGETHGWTSATSAVWSPATIEKLKELKALMEIDLGRLHLEGGGEVVPGATSPAPTSPTLDGGIGEHLGVRQV